MNGFQLEISFKGDRKYVQGTTIFDETIRLLSDIGIFRMENVEFLVYRMTSSNLELTIESGGDFISQYIDNVAVMKFCSNGQSLLARVKQLDGIPEARVVYDEFQIIDRCVINRGSRSIRIDSFPPNFSHIEVLVSITKALHLETLEKPQGTNWVFCRWKSPYWPLSIDRSGMTVRFCQTLGTRLTCAEVDQDGKVLGQVYFSAKAI